MFRKTPSSHKNLFEELRKEFSSLHKKGKTGMEKILDKYPRQSFATMVASLLLSGLLAFFILSFEEARKPEGRKLMNEVKNLGSGMRDEVSALFQISNEAKRMAQLKSEVEKIIAQDTIDFQDSIFLERAITELKRYQNLKPTHHED